MALIWFFLDYDSIEYWKELAESRRQDLQDALLENMELRNEIEELKKENAQLDEMVEEAKKLAQMVEVSKKFQCRVDDDDLLLQQPPFHKNLQSLAVEKDLDESGIGDTVNQ